MHRAWSPDDSTEVINQLLDQSVDTLLSVTNDYDQ